MQRFFRLFWSTILVGILFSGLLDLVLARHLNTQLHDMVAQCTGRNDTCGAEAINRAFEWFCFLALSGNALAFWLAYRIGRVFTNSDAAR